VSFVFGYFAELRWVKTPQNFIGLTGSVVKFTYNYGIIALRVSLHLRESVRVYCMEFRSYDVNRQSDKPRSLSTMQNKKTYLVCVVVVLEFRLDRNCSGIIFNSFNQYTSS